MVPAMTLQVRKEGMGTAQQRIKTERKYAGQLIHQTRLQIAYQWYSPSSYHKMHDNPCTMPMDSTWQGHTPSRTP
jgi:hypothetical protein